jgi:hypothetical protein
MHSSPYTTGFSVEWMFLFALHRPKLELQLLLIPPQRCSSLFEPRNAVSETPLSFADCEGLLGGERMPISAKLRQSAKDSGKSTSLPTLISKRELAWADSISLRSRQYAVTNMYLRLLYTFSDVIVFLWKASRYVQLHIDIR